MPLAARLAVAPLALVLAAGPARSQEFQPPGGGGPSTVTGGVRLGIFGFSTRTGADLTGQTQGVLGSTVDVAQLWSPRVRLRPSFELGVGGTAKSLHLAAEVIFRFQPDEAPAVPYIGFGLGYYDDAAGDDSWPTIVMGFELPYRQTFNWLIEYHSLDRLGRHRFLVGLAARGAVGS
jgi:hypothetical protein